MGRAKWEWFLLFGATESPPFQNWKLQFSCIIGMWIMDEYGMLYKLGDLSFPQSLIHAYPF